MRFTITEHTFGLAVKFQIGGDLHSAAKACESWTKAVPENLEALDDAAGWALTHQNKSFVWLMEWPESEGVIGTLVHELVHVAHGFLTKHIGENTDRAEETLCHLVQHLYRSALRKLKKYEQRKNVEGSDNDEPRNP